jgi:uncharacterized protein (TIGR00725 family)
MKKVIGVFGSAEGDIGRESLRKARLLGRAIAESGCIMVTGLPQEAAKGAKEAGGLVIGVSPAASRTEHTGKIGYPTKDMDFIVFTGSGTKVRNVMAVRSCDVAMFISGRIGTLNEFTIAYDEGKRIGILEGTGGITELVREILKKAAKETGAEVFYDSDPERLVRRCLA